MTSKIVAIGGGQVTPEITKFCLELCSGHKTKIFILALASEVANREKELALELFVARHGISPASVYLPEGLSGFRYEDLSCQEKGPNIVKAIAAQLNSARVVQALADADLLFLSGGDQRLLLELLPGTRFWEVLSNRWKTGELLVMGTSAGQQVMSEWALTGNSRSEEVIAEKNTETVRGFGFLSQVVFDQHFLKRKRFARLYSSLLDHQNCLGIGVDENTALFVEGCAGQLASRVQVLGDSAVVVIKREGSAGIRFSTEFFSAGEDFSHPLKLGLGQGLY